MTLDEFISKYNGQYVGTGPLKGQCGTLVRQYWIEVDHTSPPSYPNSKDYWFNPVPGYDKVATPKPGDIAIYDGHGVYTEGHSAISLGGTMVFEQNADPDGSPAHQFNRANTYLLGYLRKQGTSQGAIMPDDGTIDNTYMVINHKHAEESEKAAYRDKDINNPNGILYNKIFIDYQNLEQAYKDLQAAPGGFKQVGTLNGEPIYQKG